MATAVFQISDIHGNAVAASGRFAHAVNREGTSQVLRVSFSETITDAFTVAVTVTGAGSAAVTTPLSFSPSVTSAEIVVTGGATAGDFAVELAAPTGTSDPNFTSVAPVTVNFTNNDNVAVSGNTAPSDPKLHLPLEGASVDPAVAVDFQWTHAFDKDQDELQYDLCFSNTADMSAMKCVSVDETAIVAGSGIAGLQVTKHPFSGALVASVLLMMLWRRLRYPRTQVVRRIVHLGALLLVFGVGFVACGNQKLLEALRVPDRPLVKATVPANSLLESGTMYWRVYADDGKGNIRSSSTTRSLSVQ